MPELPPLRLHDSRRRTVHELVPARTVRLYVCGVTPYDSGHLGHAFTYSAFDVLVRCLRARGHRVVSCRNVTDVDNDLVRVANERGVDIHELAGEETARFDRQMAALNLLPPDLSPRATSVVDAIIVAVRGLQRRGHAYALPDGRVYFDLSTVGPPGLGTLSDLDDDERRRELASTGDDPDAEGKRHPLDFLLWQPPSGVAHEPTWPSPWGRGRPGWHIECSVMVTEELGAVIDVHGGGRDLRYPHHEAEILQAEQLTGQRPFARFWLHTGLAGLDGRKMSKSDGNLVYVGDLLADHPAGGVRRYLLEQHYRDDWSFDPSALQRAVKGFRRWEEAASSRGRDHLLAARFHEALADDLDTPAAVDVIDEAAERGAGTTVAELGALMGVALGQ